jgi:hypothetical protein
MKHPSLRLIVAGTALALLGGTAASAAAVDAPSGKKHVVCLINQDPTDTSSQQGVCVVVDENPQLPKAPKIPDLPLP